VGGTGTATASGTGAGAGANSSPTRSGSPSASSAEASATAAVSNGVALTFHGDGPPALATALLSEAERAGARLTVLAVGRWLGQYPQMARRVLDGGHELGNHTEHHIDIDTLSSAAAYAEIEDCAARLQRLTGSRGRWFRPSQAQHATATVRAAAVRAGYSTVLSYDLDSLDYTDPGTNAVVHNVLSAVRAGDVVSMHLGHQGTVEALPAILDGLRSRGLVPVTASELFPQALTVPEVAHR
jgi:peptidoglycan/xylan/chitin deacetylase (PgdA/CDA1 family)